MFNRKPKLTPLSTMKQFAEDINFNFDTVNETLEKLETRIEALEPTVVKSGNQALIDALKQADNAIAKAIAQLSKEVK